MKTSGVISSLLNRFATSRVFIFFMLCSWPYFITAQELTGELVQPILFNDSLEGFDREAAETYLKKTNYFGEEFLIKMSHYEREFITNKYSIHDEVSKLLINPPIQPIPQPTFSTAFNNSDFELSGSGTVTAMNQVAGWTITRGSHSLSTNFNSCNLFGCCGFNPEESAIFSVPNGYIDPIIGSIYPIHSVFGMVPSLPQANTLNPQISFSLKGDNFLRLNHNALGTQAYSIEKVSRTFVVSNDEKFIQYASIFVGDGGHSCCSASMLQARLSVAGSQSIVSCQTYSLVGPHYNCPTYTTSGVTFYYPITGNTVAPTSQNLVFSKWHINAIDLTPWMGQLVTFEIIASDCDAGGHFGYAYVDCKLSGLSINVNGDELVISSDSISSCGFPAVLKAPQGINQCVWQGPSGINSLSTILTTSVQGTYSLTVVSDNSCTASTHTFNLSFTDPELTLVSSKEHLCKWESATLTATGLNAYMWNTASTASSIVVFPTVNTNYVVSGMNSQGCQVSKSIKLWVWDCTGIDEADNPQNEITLYPNPNNGEFLVQIIEPIDHGYFELYSSDGKLVFGQKVLQGKNNIRIEKLSPGIYFYSISNNSKQFKNGKLQIE